MNYLFVNNLTAQDLSLAGPFFFYKLIRKVSCLLSLPTTRNEADTWIVSIVFAHTVFLRK